MPTREGCQEHESEEGQDDSDNEEVGEDDGVLERCCYPHEVEWILVDREIVHERSCVVRADVATAVPVDADAEVSDAHTELRIANDVRDSLCDARVDLVGRVGGCVLFVPERDEEDARDEW